MSSDHFVVLPSLGALKPGWVLILPKTHFLSMGAAPVGWRAEFDDLKSRVAAALMPQYGGISAFEHGPGAQQRRVGCGVDHAHLHIVPIDFDIVEAAGPFVPAGTVWSAASWPELERCAAAGIDYLYVEQPLGAGRIATHPQFGSQVFRKAIAAKLGILDKYNWREYAQQEVIIETLARLEASPFSAGGKSHPLA